MIKRRHLAFVGSLTARSWNPTLNSRLRTQTVGFHATRRFGSFKITDSFVRHVGTRDFQGFQLWQLLQMLERSIADARLVQIDLAQVRNLRKLPSPFIRN